MTVVREGNDIIIKLDASLIDIQDVQKFLDRFGIIESNARNQGTEEQVDELALEFHRDWLETNKERLSKL